MLQTRFSSHAAKMVKAAAAVCAISGMALFSNSSIAQDSCSIDAWNDAATTAMADDAVLAMRFKGKCGLKASIADGDTVAHSDQFSSETSVFSLFYVLTNMATIGASDSVTIYQMVDASDNVLLDVKIEGSNAVLTVGTASASVALGTGWNAVLVQASDSSDAQITIGSNSATATGGQLNTGVDGVLLGAIAATGATGDLLFDYYVANRTTAPALLVNCNPDDDANNQTNVDDIIALINENNGGDLANGTPDCIGDGQTNVDDIIAAININNS